MVLRMALELLGWILAFLFFSGLLFDFLMTSCRVGAFDWATIPPFVFYSSWYIFNTFELYFHLYFSFFPKSISSLM